MARFCRAEKILSDLPKERPSSMDIYREPGPKRLADRRKTMDFHGFWPSKKSVTKIKQCQWLGFVERKKCYRLCGSEIVHHRCLAVQGWGRKTSIAKKRRFLGTFADKNDSPGNVRNGSIWLAVWFCIELYSFHRSKISFWWKMTVGRFLALCAPVLSLGFLKKNYLKF